MFVHVDFLIPLITFLATLASMFTAIYLVLGLILFCIFKSGIPIFIKILPFSFYLVNSECGAYVAIDHGLVYVNYPKMFLQFFSLILSLIPVFKPFFMDSYLSFVS